MKTICIALAAFATIGCTAQKRNIAVTQLPKTAQDFIKANFPNQATSYIIEDKDIHETEYEVRFTGGAEVEFDGNGNWKEVDANKSVIPKSVLPKAIATYTDQNYKGQSVEKIERKNWGYKVEFTSDIELEFDNAGKFLRIDD
jgi:Putative beta-lactamase-inhibitor-like, PepSY-like